MQGHQRALRGVESGVGDVDERSPHNVDDFRPAVAVLASHQFPPLVTGNGLSAAQSQRCRVTALSLAEQSPRVTAVAQH